MKRAFCRSRFPLPSHKTTTFRPAHLSALSSSLLPDSNPNSVRFSPNSIRFSTTDALPPNHVSDALPPTQNDLTERRQKTRRLPLSCPGCGALSQTIASDEAGYYALSRSTVKKYVQDDVKQEDRVFEDTISKVDGAVLEKLGLHHDAVQHLHDKTAQHHHHDKTAQPKETPICDRCHNLLHHHTGVPIFHPSVDSIRHIIQESPHKHNHIYHVLDAADFPMSLIPNLLNNLDLPPLRTQNRRSKTTKYIRDRVVDVSFIITRSDLLAPNKEQVDTLMPYLREVLRDALGRTGKNVRLGNLRLVSSKRGWWSKNVKQDIWDRGGAAWMVGKVNVGKSNLFEVVYPKARGQEHNPSSIKYIPDTSGNLTPAMHDHPTPDMDDSLTPEANANPDMDSQDELELSLADHDSLLPPAQPETAYPVMPIISSLPGTTASPIRVPFGGGKGELIDLPGVARTNLDQFVLPDHHQDLVMRSRHVPEQLSIKPGQSLLLGGGLIRITPKTPDLVFLSYSFLPLKPHVTSTEKAESMVTGERPIGIHSIMTEDARQHLASAGTFKLDWDVTKKRAGPLTSPSAAKLKPDQLAFKIYSADILIEGVGWIELVAQVRTPKKRFISTLVSNEFVETNAPPAPPSEADTSVFKPLGVQDPGFEQQTIPEVEVFSPKGKFVGVRSPMNAWMLGGKKAPPANARKSRPRVSMKSLKSTQRGRDVQRSG